MAYGTIKWFNKEKGFGFIMPDDGGRDIYFPASHIEGEVENISDGQRVQYEMSIGRKGPEAKHVKGIH